VNIHPLAVAVTTAQATPPEVEAAMLRASHSNGAGRALGQLQEPS
jgi:hypothetical protein